MYARMYVCTYVCLYVCMYVCMCVYVFLHMCKMSTNVFISLIQISDYYHPAMDGIWHTSLDCFDQTFQPPDIHLSTQRVAAFLSSIRGVRLRSASSCAAHSATSPYLRLSCDRGATTPRSCRHRSDCPLCREALQNLKTKAKSP